MQNRTPSGTGTGSTRFYRFDVRAILAGLSLLAPTATRNAHATSTAKGAIFRNPILVKFPLIILFILIMCYYITYITGEFTYDNWATQKDKISSTNKDLLAENTPASSMNLLLMIAMHSTTLY